MPTPGAASSRRAEPKALGAVSSWEPGRPADLASEPPLSLCAHPLISRFLCDMVTHSQGQDFLSSIDTNLPGVSGRVLKRTARSQQPQSESHCFYSKNNSPTHADGSPSPHEEHPNSPTGGSSRCRPGPQREEGWRVALQLCGPRSVSLLGGVGLFWAAAAPA